jgi:haloalkane dehalogenase
VIAAYEAPFPDESYKAGARAFPALVPGSPDDPAAPANRAAWERLERFDKPFLTAFADNDPITRGADAVFQARVPGAASLPHVTVPGAHFVQEDAGPRLAELIAKLIATT